MMSDLVEKGQEENSNDYVSDNSSSSSISVISNQMSEFGD